MNRPPQNPVLGSTLVTAGLLILAVSLTLLSSLSRGSKQVSTGNVCGVNENEPCIVSIPTAGWPLPYMVDQLGTSAIGVLGLEDFRIIAFMLDILFYALLLGGLRWLLSRIQPVQQ